MKEEIKLLIDSLNSVLVGKEEKVKLAVTTLLAEGHLLIEDVPGVGKTTLAKGLARCIDASFGRIQFTPDTLPSDVTGISIYNMNTGSFKYEKGPILNNIVLADEINRTSPKTQASLLEAMEEKQISVDGKMFVIEKPFMVIATQNPVEFLGTYNLPEAQLDRFMMRISLGYPDKEQEKKLAVMNIKNTADIGKVITKEQLLEAVEEVKNVRVHDDIVAYVVNITDATRNNENISLGASPRATIALLSAARAKAYIEGRGFVTPDDIKELLLPVLSHRIMLSVEAKMKKVTVDEVLRSCIRDINVPIVKA